MHLTQFQWRIGLLMSIGLLGACQPDRPPPGATTEQSTTAATGSPLPTSDASSQAESTATGQRATTKPEIAGVRLALAIDPKTMQLRGSSGIFRAAILNRLKKLHVAVLLKGLRGGETLTLTLVDPTGKESVPLVKQYSHEDQGDFYATAFFEAATWKTGPHQVKVNLNDESFAIHEFGVVP